MKLSRSRFAALAVAALLSAAGCSSSSGGKSSSTSSPSSAPLKIGISLPLTGEVADVAKSGYEGYQQWAAQVNASGGLLGRQVQLVVHDDGFQPAQAGSDYTRLISQDKVDLLLGTFSSLLNAPASAIAERQGFLYVEPSGGSASLFTRGFKKLFFAQPATTTDLPNQFVQYVTSLPAAERPKTAAYVTQDDPSSSPAVSIFKTKFEALGIRTVYNQTYSPDASNFDTVASAVAASKPDLLIHGAVGNDGPQLVRSLQKVSFSPRVLFQTKTPADPGYAAAVGVTNAEGIFTAEAWSPQSKYPGDAEFVSTYTSKFGHAPTEDAANSYTAGQVLAAAVKPRSTDDLRLSSSVGLIC